MNPNSSICIKGDSQQELTPPQQTFDTRNTLEDRGHRHRTFLRNLLVLDILAIHKVERSLNEVEREQEETG
jgi:hypothetical protein